MLLFILFFIFATFVNNDLILVKDEITLIIKNKALKSSICILNLIISVFFSIIFVVIYHFTTKQFNKSE